MVRFKITQCQGRVKYNVKLFIDYIQERRALRVNRIHFVSYTEYREDDYKPKIISPYQNTLFYTCK